MKFPIREIALLYVREKTLRMLAVLFLASIAVTFSHEMIMQINVNRVLATTLQSAVVMIGLWMTFLIGIILKRQLASHRASLLPGYRSMHAVVFAVILCAFVAIGYFWALYLARLFHVSLDDHLAVVAAGTFVAVINIILGYISAAWLVFVFFIAFCLFSDPVYMAVGSKVGFVETNVLTLIAAGLISVIFLKRFWDVREESFEYPYIFSWSQRRYAALRRGNIASAARVLVFLRRILGFSRDIVIRSSYRPSDGLLARVMHWECLKWDNYKIGIIVLAVLTPVYILYIHWVPAHFASFLRGHLVYFLLGVYPVVLSVGLNQRGVLHWGYELTKPVSRASFIREKGAGMLIEIGLYWVVALVFLVIIPYGVLDPLRLVSTRFWAEIGLTLTFALTVFGWIACLRGASQGLTVLSLVCLAGLTGYQFFSIASFPLTGITAGIFVWLIVGILLCRVALRQWSNAEIN